MLMTGWMGKKKFYLVLAERDLLHLIKWFTLHQGFTNL